MAPEHIVLKQAIAEERARLWVLVRHDIAALRQLVDESQHLMDDARPELLSLAIGTPAAALPSAEQDANS